MTPKVLLTAAHCTEGTLGKTIVTFAVLVDDAPPSNLPRAVDDPGAGLSPRLNQKLFTLVGYGTEVRKNPTGPQNPIPQSYPIVRRYADEPGQKLTPQILQTHDNDNTTAGAGAPASVTPVDRPSRTTTSRP